MRPALVVVNGDRSNFYAFFGLPGFRIVDSNPSFLHMRLTQSELPYGVPRFTLRRSASNSASVSTPLTYSAHLRDRGIGQRLNKARSSWFPLSQIHKLDHGQASAWDTKLARSALPSTYRTTW